MESPKINLDPQETFIKEAWSEQTGGGILNDFIVLKSGKTIRISDELICVYENEDAGAEGVEPIASVYH